MNAEEAQQPNSGGNECICMCCVCLCACVCVCSLHTLLGLLLLIDGAALKCSITSAGGTIMPLSFFPSPSQIHTHPHTGTHTHTHILLVKIATLSSHRSLLCVCEDPLLCFSSCPLAAPFTFDHLPPPPQLLYAGAMTAEESWWWTQLLQMVAVVLHHLSFHRNQGSSLLWLT